MAPSMDRSHNMVVPPTGTSLETLVTDIISKVKDSRNFWTRLPNILCQNPEVGAGKDKVEQNCWNGRDRGTYTQRLTGDGLSAQDQNPEVDVDSSRPDTRINEQKLNLKLASNKLENAYNGHSVEWPHYESSKFLHPSPITIKETVQGTCDSDSTCLYSAIAKPNMTIKSKKLSIF